jgi:predicted nucleic acid-binding protein
MILSADTNLFLYAANPDSPHHEAAQRFFEEEAEGNQRFTGQYTPVGNPSAIVFLDLAAK